MTTWQQEDDKIDKMNKAIDKLDKAEDKDEGRGRVEDREENDPSRSSWVTSCPGFTAGDNHTTYTTTICTSLIVPVQ